MKIKDIFEEEVIGTDTVMVSMDNTILNGIVRANETAAYIISQLKSQVTEDELISNLSSKYGISFEHASRSVKKILSQLRDLKLLEE